jgi:hypothetical protein
MFRFLIGITRAIVGKEQRKLKTNLKFLVEEENLEDKREPVELVLVH